MFSWKWLRAFRFQFKKKQHKKPTINFSIAIGQTRFVTGLTGIRSSDRLSNTLVLFIQMRLKTSWAGNFTIKGEHLAFNQGLKISMDRPSCSHGLNAFQESATHSVLCTPKRQLFPRYTSTCYVFWGVTTPFLVCWAEVHKAWDTKNNFKLSSNTIRVRCQSNSDSVNPHPLLSAGK